VGGRGGGVTPPVPTLIYSWFIFKSLLATDHVILILSNTTTVSFTEALFDSDDHRLKKNKTDRLCQLALLCSLILYLLEYISADYKVGKPMI
jgi:hypothetical protein